MTDIRTQRYNYPDYAMGGKDGTRIYVYTSPARWPDLAAGDYVISNDRVRPKKAETTLQADGYVKTIQRNLTTGEMVLKVSRLCHQNLP